MLEKNAATKFNVIAQVPLSLLSIDENVNVRRSRAGVEPQFAASIRARGVIEPLTVRAVGKGFTITNGGKRFAALHFLLDAKEIEPDYMVPVIVREEDDAAARETSLVTNIVRADMHPVETFRAFADMVKDGKTPDAIAMEYAMTLKDVDRTLALGRLSETIQNAWLNNMISADAAKAFTLAPDKKAQDRVYAKLKAAADKRQYRTGVISDLDIKQEFKANHQDSGRFVQFIGIEAYEKRGGKVTRDLFGSDHVISDVKLAKAMAAERLDEECKKLIEAGWSWAVPEEGMRDSYSYGRIESKFKPIPEEAARIDKLEATINADNDDPVDAEQAELDRIEAEISARAFTPEQKAKSGCFVSIDRAGALAIKYGMVKPEEKRKVEAQQRAETRKKKTKTAEKTGDTSAMMSNALQQRLSTQLAKATQAALVADSYDDDLAILLAKIVAALIEPDRLYGTPSPVLSKMAEIRNGITPKVMKAALHKEFDAADYFSGAPKPLALKAIAEAVNADAARKIAGKPKAEIAKFALANVVKTGWLPEQMRTARYDGPGAKAAKQKKKKAA